MAKIDPFSLSRPPRKSGEKTFTDPAQPGLEWFMSLKALDNAERHAVQEYAETMIAKYLGDPESGVPPQVRFPAIGQEVVTLSRRLLFNAATLWYMQTAKEPEGYSFEQIVGLSVTMPNAWWEVVAWSNELAEVGESKNDSGAGTEPSQ